MDTAAYFSRIGYTGSLEPVSSTLLALHQAHLLAVPFENLDIHLQRPIRLVEEALFDKIITRRRGGFCYELNGLFAHLLEALGFTVQLLSASSSNDDGTYAPEFDHLALKVQTTDSPETAWLVDVGWGDGFLRPLKAVENSEQKQAGRVFRIVSENGYHVVTEQTVDGNWLKHYRFNLVPHTLDEFIPMCLFHQTSPESMFTQKRLCTLFTPEGRITLSEQKLITTKDSGGLRGSGIREERILGDEIEIRRTLDTMFHLQEQGPEITPSPIDIASFRDRWSPYENETYGFSFLYPSVYEGGKYGFCKVREQAGNTTQEESVFALNVGSRIQLTLKKTGENTLSEVVEAYRIAAGHNDAQFEEAQERMVAGLPALTLPYRIGGTNRYAEATFWIKDGILYQVEASTPSACDVEAIGLRELNAYQKLLESFRYL